MDKLALAQEYLEQLKSDPIDNSRLEALLAEDAQLLSTSGNTAGRDAVIARMTEPSGKVFRESKWARVEAMGDAIKATGIAPGSGNGSPILVFNFRDGKIAEVQHQFYTARVPGNTPVRLSEDMKDRVNNSLERKHPIVLAYVDENNAPMLSFRGSIQAFSDTQLAFWARPESRVVEALGSNPRISFIYRNEDNHEGMIFQGRARVSSDPAETSQVYEHMAAIEQERDMARLGVAVIVDLDSVEGSVVRPGQPTERVRMGS